MSGFLPAMGLGFFSPGNMMVMFLEPEGDEPAATTPDEEAAADKGNMAEGVVTTGGDESDEMDVLRGMGKLAPIGGVESGRLGGVAAAAAPATDEDAIP